MRWIIVLCLFAGCRVCVDACKKTQGRTVTAVVPNPDGTIKITTCMLTTEGTGASVGGCVDHLAPAP